MKFKITLLPSLLLCLFMCTKANAQFTSMNHETIYRVSLGTTYIVMDDTNTAIAKEYKSIFYKYWTTSPIKFIVPDEIRKVDTLRNSIFGMGRLLYSVNGNLFPISPYLGLRIYGKDLVNIYIATNPVKYGPAKKGTEDDKTLPPNRVHNDPDRQILPSFSYGEPDFAWGPGFLKNYLQQTMAYLRTRNEKNMKDEITGNAELKKTKRQNPIRTRLHAA